MSGGAEQWLWLAAPAHLFGHLRGAYDLSNPAAIWRTIALLAGSAVVFVFYFLLILLVGLFA